MTLGPNLGVRRQAIRVALGAALVVAIAYLAVSVAVVTVVTRDLTAQVDHRLGEALNRVPTGRDPDEAFERPAGDRPFGPPTLIWAVTPDGSVLTDAETPGLPEQYETVTGPLTASIDGTELRLQGTRMGDLYVVVGQSLESVSDARSTIVLAEVIIAPVLLLVVFLGAVAIGRRVAAPIEAARRRQLDFTADASHELRTPLSVIEANTSLALTEDRDETWYRSAFERVDQESKRMRGLLDDMLWLARFDAAQAPPGSEPVDLGVLAAQTADRFAAVAETRGVRLTVHVPDGAASVAAPPELLDRLLGVLLDNACKYVPEGGLVDVTVARDGSRVAVTVDDSGPGIPATDRDRIFDRFHRASEPAGGPSGTSGAGLGLAIADAIVRATGGRWQLGTSSAGGARFSVSWPRTL
ncbi:MAG TPA: HAMP domain-containing sensor histidine kinase [Candidatus Limnocylindrales bacterium]|nr:HAMP domain-containing sensor histidine kinase [Candidatus Limnocylindrales bacterium]